VPIGRYRFGLAGTVHERKHPVDRSGKSAEPRAPLPAEPGYSFEAMSDMVSGSGAPSEITQMG
jgi:hypothetical protein